MYRQALARIFQRQSKPGRQNRILVSFHDDDVRRRAITRQRRHAAPIRNYETASDATLNLAGKPESYFRGDMTIPKNSKVLLHSCCAPCSGAMIEEMRDEGQNVTIFFYNPNIHPKDEYVLRKEENKRYAKKLGVSFVDLDSDDDDDEAKEKEKGGEKGGCAPSSCGKRTPNDGRTAPSPDKNVKGSYDEDVRLFHKLSKGMEFSPERGDRCTMCFDMRFEKTAQYAATNGFQYITTTNATSRWKDADQVNKSGQRSAKMYALEWWDRDWQTDEMSERKYKINAEESFYKQEYCGCSYSLRDSNIFRKQNGMDAVKIAAKDNVYDDPAKDCEEESWDVVRGFFEEVNEGDNYAKDYLMRKRDKKKIDGVYENRKKNQQGVKENNW